jgi:magnesium-transporting ATPase (P-type)
MGLFDRMCSAEAMMTYPTLYKMSQSGQLFNVRVFWVWIGNAMLHSLLLYWLPLLAFQQDVVWGHGRDGGYLVLGNTVYSVSQALLVLRHPTNVATLIAVRGDDSVFESSLGDQLLDVDHPPCHLGLNRCLVPLPHYL